MITEIKAEAATNYGKTWCETCAHTLYLEDFQEDPLGEEALTFLMSVATRHEHIHPTHNIEVRVYENTLISSSLF